MAANERAASVSLKTVATAETDFRTNDRDSNGIHDYWVGDVSGLYRYTVNNKEIKLIEKSLADADASPLKSPSLSTLKRDQPGSDFDVLVGFKLTPEQVERNRARAQ